MKSIFYFLLIPLLFTVFFSCSDSNDKETYDLTFEKSDYPVMNGYSTYIMIRSGNRDYTITPGDKDMLEVNYKAPTVGMGDIQIRGKKKGTTTLTVKDNITNQEVKLNITVTNAYLSSRVLTLRSEISIPNAEDKKKIEDDIAGNALLKEKQVFTLVKDENKTLYIFNSEADLHKGEYLFKGTYKLTAQPDNLYLELNYKDGATMRTVTNAFGNDSGRTVYYTFFELGNIPKLTKAPGITTIYSDLINDCTVEYKPLYTNLEKAVSTTHISLMLPTTAELPTELVK